MEQATYEQLTKKDPELDVPEERLEKWTQLIERHFESGQPEFLYFHDDFEAFRQFVTMMGHRHLEASKILAYKYTNTADGHQAEEFPASLTGTVDLLGFLERLADNHGGMLEFPNNFKIGVIVECDGETIIAYKYELDEQPVVCEGCELALQTGEEARGYYSDYSCEHREDDYGRAYSAHLFSRPSEKDLQDFLMWQLA